MAGVYFKACTGSVSISTSAKTVLQVTAASNHAVKIREWSVGFNGVDNTHAPILVQLCRQSDAGSGGSSLTLRKDPDDAAETLQTTAIYGCTSEPTTADVLDSMFIHPQQGVIWQARFGEEIKIGGGDRVGIICTAANNTNCVARMFCEE